jgi:hypothetical protein
MTYGFVFEICMDIAVTAGIVKGSMRVDVSRLDSFSPPGEFDKQAKYPPLCLPARNHTAGWLCRFFKPASNAYTKKPFDLWQKQKGATWHNTLLPAIGSITNIGT